MTIATILKIMIETMIENDSFHRAVGHSNLSADFSQVLAILY